MAGLFGTNTQSSSDSPWARVLAAMGMQQYNETNPVLKNLLASIDQILQGNLYGPGTAPFVQQGVGAARQATAQSMQGAEKFLSETGTSRSPYAAAILSNIQQQGNQNVANVGTEIGSKFLSMAPGVLEHGIGNSISALSSAMQGDMTSSSSSKSNASAVQGGLGMLGGVTGMFGG